VAETPDYGDGDEALHRRADDEPDGEAVYSERLGQKEQACEEPCRHQEAGHTGRQEYLVRDKECL